MLLMFLKLLFIWLILTLYLYIIIFVWIGPFLWFGHSYLILTYCQISIYLLTMITERGPTTLLLPGYYISVKTNVQTKSLLPDR
jgi:hypothetical protein